MSKKKYVLEEFRAIQNKIKDSNEEYTSHMVIGVDMDENGYPEDRRTNHCLNLIPVISVSHQYTLPIKVLENYTDFAVLLETESKRIKDGSTKP